MRGPHELVERLAGCDLDHPPEHVGRHAVVPALPRIRQQRQVGHPGREVFEPLGLGEQTRFVVEPVDGRVAGEPVGQARRVGQQMLDGDRAVRRHPVAVRGVAVLGGATGDDDHGQRREGNSKRWTIHNGFLLDKTAAVCESGVAAPGVTVAQVLETG